MVLQTEAGTARTDDAGDRCDDAHLSHSQALRLEYLFAQHYVARNVAGSVEVSVGATASFKSDGRRLYGTIQSIQGEAALIKLDGAAGEMVQKPLANLLARRSRLSRSIKRSWARDLCVAGGTSAVAHAYRLWARDLANLLIVVRYKVQVFAVLTREEVILLADVRRVCDGIADCPPQAAHILFERIALEAPKKKPLTAHFARRSGKGISYRWTELGLAKYAPAK
jgi:hypothetical protein